LEIGFHSYLFILYIAKLKLFLAIVELIGPVYIGFAVAKKAGIKLKFYQI